MSVHAEDGPCGELEGVVVDPDGRSITHLVVEPPHHRALARLVPREFAAVDGEAVRLRCTRERWHDFPHAREVEFIPPYELWIAMRADEMCWPSAYVRECVPDGEVEIHRGEHIHATDGRIGHIEGVLVDPENHHVLSVLLREGHLRSRKTVAVPFADAARFADDGAHVALTRWGIRHLPQIPRAS